MTGPKFRGWSNEYDHYCSGLQYDSDFGWEGILESEFEYQTDPEPLVELYTGLKDKNGKEIYEGDILGDMWGGGYIAWCDKCKQLQYHISTHECMACLGDVQWYELVNDNGKLEVIGNIHENPELLEEGKWARA